MLANHLGHPLTDPLRHLSRVIHDPAELAILPDRYGAFLEPRIFWTPQYPEPGAATPIQVNKDLVTNYLRAADELRFQTSVSAALDVVALLRLPGVSPGDRHAGQRAAC
jgi:hypothetical protein